MTKADRKRAKELQQDRILKRIVAEVRAAGGIVTCHRLWGLGHSAHFIALAVERKLLSRVRKGWIGLPNLDEELVRAVADGVVLTCVTQARRLGLWVLEEDMRHVGAPPHAGGVRARKSHIHWCVPPIAREPGAVVDPIENVLAIVAQCQPHDPALAIWESALRKGLVSVDVLRALPLGPAGRELCAEAVPWSDSGLESFVEPRLRWMRLPIRPQIWLHGHRVDFLIGNKLVLQIDGGHHVGEQRTSDVAHDALLMVMGYHVIRVTYAQMVDDWPQVQAQIMRAVARGLHL